MQEILTNRVCVAELPKQKLDILLVKVTWNLRKLKLIRFSYGSIKDVFNLVVFNLTWQEQVIYICIAQKTKYANGDQKLKTSSILIVLCIFAPWNVFRAQRNKHGQHHCIYCDVIDEMRPFFIETSDFMVNSSAYLSIWNWKVIRIIKIESLREQTITW